MEAQEKSSGRRLKMKIFTKAAAKEITRKVSKVEVDGRTKWQEKPINNILYVQQKLKQTEK